MLLDTFHVKKYPKQQDNSRIYELMEQPQHQDETGTLSTSFNIIDYLARRS